MEDILKVDNQIKNDENNIYRFVKYVSKTEKNNNLIFFLDNQYKEKEINDLMERKIEYHLMFNNVKFDIWLFKNIKKIQKSIIFIKVNNLNLLTKQHIKKIRKYTEEIIIEFGSNIQIEEVKEFANTINKNIIIGYVNYGTENLKRVIMLIGKKFEYIKKDKKLKVLAIIHTYNEEDVIRDTIEYLLKQDIDVYVLDNWSTDNTYNILKELKNIYSEKIALERYPKEKPTENIYNWTEQLHRTEKLAKTLDYDWFIHYDADEIRVTPYLRNITLKEMIEFVDSLGYNAINTTILDFRMTDKNDNIFAKNTYFEFGRKPTHFMQIKTWKKCEDIDLATTGGHIAQFKNQKVYPLKIINKHYPLRSLKQAKKKVYIDRLPRFEKEKKEKGWHCHYDKIAHDKDFIYDKKNLNKYDKNILEKFTLELISGIGIDKL